MASISSKQYLSKSLFIRGLQCCKSLYLDKYHPELKDEMPASKEALFERGHEVGRMAQNLFPGGVEIPYEGLSHKEQLEMTQSEIKKGTTTLYEATFNHNGVSVKVDILHKDKKGWGMYEVKDSTKLKEDVHIDDVAIQYYVLKGSGLPISKAFLVHLNNAYVRDGEIEVDKLFTISDLTKTVKKKQPCIEKEIRKQRKMLGGDLPDIDIGEHCESPYACDFMGHCWAHIPEISVFDIKRIGAKAYDLYREGIVRLKDIPDDVLSSQQRVQVEATLKKKDFIDPDRIRKFLKSLRHPLCFLDFETLQSPIPLWDGTKPWQQIPFQYSLHVLETEKGKLKHYEYLALPSRDPRKELVQKLISEIPDKACVVAYNKSFETNILNDLAATFPKYKKRIKKITEQMIDLMVPFMKKDVYLWQMYGSYSLKDVLPALVPELSYGNMEISDGGMAADAYFRMRESNDPKEVEKIRRALLDYCRLDTFGMVKIVEKLKEYCRA